MSKSSIIPLGDRVLISPAEKEQVTSSGIIIPDTARSEAPQSGTVLALGNGGLKKDSIELRKQIGMPLF